MTSVRNSLTGPRTAAKLLATALLLAPITLAGCGKGGPDLGKPVEISGKVTMDGKPSAGVQVLLTRTTPGGGAKDRDFMAKTDENGDYKLPGVYPANYLVRVTEIKQEDPQQILAFDSGPYVKYGSEASGLTAEVQESQRDFSFNLTSK